ncbi:hypothetical protein IWW36_003673 [Coemansia brasiliensis]|uniref:Uncharacterized protein n=1 Tax=Coemansia brasiliensis TaxID=2650707 RepID=A0A9W8LZI8_9FUNG|nr:hypothetical protein IWW36_003673 [Coemansia brasiliensis]
MDSTIEHTLNWCRLCRVCLTCKRTPRVLFQSTFCTCEERSIRHSAREVRANGTADFRFRRLNNEERTGLTHLLSEMHTGVSPIEPNLARANLCGTCQQRLRRAVEAVRNPQNDVQLAATADFRRHRSIRATIQENNAKAASQAMITVSLSAADSTVAGIENDRQMSIDGSAEAAISSSQLSNLRSPTSTEGSPASVTMPRQPWTHSMEDILSESACCSQSASSAGATSLGMQTTPSYTVVDVTVIDASETTLFSERVSGSMPLQELLYAYYPNAPHRLLFRDQATKVLVPPQSPVSRLAHVNGSAVVKVHLPANVPKAQWHSRLQQTIESASNINAPPQNTYSPPLNMPLPIRSYSFQSGAYSARLRPSGAPSSSQFLREKQVANNSSRSGSISPVISKSPGSSRSLLPISCLVNSEPSTISFRAGRNRHPPNTLPRLNLTSALNALEEHSITVQHPIGKRLRPSGQ